MVDVVVILILYVISLRLLNLVADSVCGCCFSYTKKFKRTLNYFNTDTQYAHIRLMTSLIKFEPLCVGILFQNATSHSVSNFLLFFVSKFVFFIIFLLLIR